MLTVLSPAKTLDFDTPAATRKQSAPAFAAETEALVQLMQKKSSQELKKLMSISDKLAELNADRYASFNSDSENLKQAILAFKGDVYIGLDVDSYNERDFTFAQKSLRILSGLYGVLRPLDLIHPYRLEMGTKLRNSKGNNLYDFWDSAIGEALAEELCSHRNKTLINLASNEYFNAVDESRLPGDVITPVFKDYSRGTYRVLSFFAKKARGAMATYIVQNRINKPADLKNFDIDGYQYNDGFSSDDRWVFTRKG
ncbi:MAG: peroxide stress protein YaaA [Gammaproteobacteria bacterium]